MTTFESRLDYSHRDIDYLPDDIIQSFKSVSLLDVSNNKISDVCFVGRFTNLHSLILDHNLITGEAVFPVMPTLNTLWLNFNEIRRLIPFIVSLKKSFPNLRHLSMMGNVASPPCSEDTFYDYINYRLVVVSFFPGMEYLDDRPVSQDEREEAYRLYGGHGANSTQPSTNITDIVFSWVDKVISFIDPTPVTGTGTSSNNVFSNRASVI